MIPKCTHCEEKDGSVHKYGQFLCVDCLASLAEYEAERRQDEAAKLQQLVEGKPVQPSIAADLYMNAVKLGNALIFRTNNDKIEDYFNSNVAPIIHLMKDEEIASFFTIVERQYFFLKNALSIRKIDRQQEAEALKHTTKVEKTRARATVEIEKQKKHASKDKTLTKEQRDKAKIIEGLMGMGMTEADASAQYEQVMKARKK